MLSLFLIASTLALANGFGFPGMSGPFPGGFSGQEQGPYVPSYEPHSTVGSLAGFKGDLLYPVFTIGFFIFGVIIVVKLVLMFISAIKGKLGLVEIDGRSSRSGRAMGEKANNLDELNRITTVVMAALSTDECMKRTLCEVGRVSKKFDEGGVSLITTVAEKIAPKSMEENMKIFTDANKCDRFKCGELKTRK